MRAGLLGVRLLLLPLAGLLLLCVYVVVLVQGAVDVSRKPPGAQRGVLSHPARRPPAAPLPRAPSSLASSPWAPRAPAPGAVVPDALVPDPQAPDPQSPDPRALESRELRPRASSSRPLLFEPPVVQVGRLEAGSSKEVEVAWRREGAGDLRVNGVAADCGCVVPEALPQPLVEGARGVLRVRVLARRTHGPFRHRVRFVVGGVLSTLTLTGWVEGRVGVNPASLALGPRAPGSAIVRSLQVRTAPEAPPGPLQATLEGLDGEVRIGPSTLLGGHGWTIEVRLGLPRAPGPFAGAIVLRLKEEPAIRVPVTGRVVAGSSATGVASRGTSPQRPGAEGATR